MGLLLIGLLVACIPFVLPIAGWVSARRNRRRIAALESLLARQEEQIAVLNARLDQVAARVPREEGPARATAPADEQPERASTTVPAVPAAEPQPEWTGYAAGEAGPAVPVSEGMPPASSSGTGRPLRAPSLPAFDWERLVGVKLFSAIAGVALVLAAIFFLRYTIDQGWMQPPVRVAIGVLVAIALLAVCELKAARQYPVTANALDAAAIAILFATFFAAHALWNLIPAVVAFALLAAVTAVAVVLSIRRESLFIAVLGLLGGFATPVLLSTGENRPIPLFAYLILLNIGLAWVAYRQVWPMLTALTLVLTTIYQWGWVIRYLDASAIPLAMAIFLVFPAAAVVGLTLARRDGSEDATGRSFERTALLSAALPLVFATYLSAVPAYGEHAALLFGFLLLIDAALLAIGLARRQELLHAAGALTTLLVMAVWLATSYGSPGHALLGLGVTSLYVLLYLVAPEIADRLERPFTGAASRSHYAAPLLLFVFPVLAAIEPAFAAPLALVTTLVVLLLIVAWRAVATADGWLYFIAAFFAVAAQASWSAAHLAAGRLGTAVAIYAVFGVLAIGTPIVARRAGRPLAPVWGSGAVLLASLAVLLFLSLGPVSSSALWALALLLAILNAGLFVESASGALPLVSQAGSLASWAVLASWWARAAAAVGIGPSLTVLAALSVTTVAGHSWAYRIHVRDPEPARAAPFARGLYLVLVGHLFLAVLASNPEWGLPPWPLFTALAVMTAATSGASLVTRTPALHAAGVIAAAFVVATWAGAAGSPSWGLTAALASAAVSTFALAWTRLAGERGKGVSHRATGAALFLGELALLAAVAGGARPPASVETVAHAANLAAILTLTWRNRWRFVAVAAVVPAWLAVAQWQLGVAGAVDWRHLLGLASTLYAVFIAYPLVLGAAARHSRDPYTAAVLASAMFFFGARSAFAAGGLPLVGGVPIAEAAVLVFLVWGLLGIEPAGGRDLGRLALVAGAALAFVTVAIPLQLRHQWITLGWALEGAALAWLHARIPHRGLLYTVAGLLAAVFVRLTINPDVLVYQPRGALPILNWYLYTYLTSAVSMLLAARWLVATGDRVVPGLPRLSHLLPAAAVILLFLLLNIEIADFYARGPTITFRFGATLSQDLTYTIGWLAFGMALLAAGIYLHSRPARIAAVALIAVTTFKCFLYDLGSLEGLYRVASFVGLALSLALVSLALQKYVLSRPGSTAHGA